MCTVTVLEARTRLGELLNRVAQAERLSLRATTNLWPGWGRKGNGALLRFVAAVEKSRGIVELQFTCLEYVTERGTIHGA